MKEKKIKSLAPVGAIVSVSLNFNNDIRYQFTVGIPVELDRSDACKLIGVNYAGQSFALDGLGKALMRLLVQLDLATMRADDPDFVEEFFWEIHPSRSKKKRHIAAMHAEVTSAGEVEQRPEASASDKGVVT